MAFLKLMVFSAVAIILASSKKGDKKGGLRSLTALVEQQTKKISDITREINELKARKNDVMVVSGEEDLREERCAKVCAGTSVRGATNWVDTSSNGIYTEVDISKCGFVTIPTVTSSLEGTKSHWKTTGSSEIYRATTSTFKMYLFAPDGRGGVANEKGWNVEWIAVGYIC
ncbi:uncharacterized protein LOC134825262 [Bolinopsis microptera]|uniref:uncharacterized protein LOC134825262 n=1 Tax=Bolinopsis microptera TaxID=2820187 RepID=UPI0030790284